MADKNSFIMAPTLEDLNDLPLNRKAGEMLERLDLTLDPKCLHAVRLALWAIDAGHFEANEGLDGTVRAMETWLPQRLTSFLMPDGEFFYGPEGWEEADDPETLACLILNDLEERVAAFFPWYLTPDW